MACEDAEVFYWLHERNIKPKFEISLDKTASEGDLASIQWLDEHKLAYPEVKLIRWSTALYEAAYAGHLNIIQWIHANRPDDFEEAEVEPLDDAIEGGHVTLAKWLVDNTTTYGIRGLIVTDMRMVQWLLREDTIRTAATNGDLEIVQLLYDLHEVESDPTWMDPAAAAGHVDAVKWFSSHKTSCSTNAMDGAAKNGHLDVLQWLHTLESCGCLPEAIKMTARQGHFEIVKWLHKTGLGQLNPDVMHKAVSCGHLSNAQYVYDIGDHSQSWTGKEMKAAARRGQLEIVQWLADEIASNGHLEVLQYLTSLPDYKVRCTGMGALRAACFGHFAVVEWLLIQDLTIVALRGLERVTL